ncbi:MAG: flavodoxin-dependent (E)-4-hydroxy-3-methylbut-2-enyl-diphosphate synthase, partial [Alistipes sp.]|nr:flavodoxin-dependent (E)-4-hydroxy-3-methylbut-2-enyl-diphosphate synthase [Alistipes sp.]
MAEITYQRRATHEVRIANTTIGGSSPIAVQSMTNTPTANIELSVAQTKRIAAAGAEIVRLTAQGKREGEALQPIMQRLRAEGCHAAIVADIHFVPEIAMIAAEAVDKVRINPGNFRTSNGELQRLIEICRRRGVALRIGVNHGSLAKRIFDEYGDTPEGMVAS